MPSVLVTPVIDLSVRDLCRKPYPGHPFGCPNWGRRDTCPPRAPRFDRVIDLAKPVWAIYNAFDLAGHVDRMREAHPDWSWRQLVCCLYWQKGARNTLEAELAQWLFQRAALGESGYQIFRVPEACGVNVTETMASVGVHLEWPPIRVAYQVALAGTAKE